MDFLRNPRRLLHRRELTSSFGHTNRQRADEVAVRFSGWAESDFVAESNSPGRGGKVQWVYDLPHEDGQLDYA